MITELSQFASRPPPSSPSLIALLEPLPPSPILTPSDLSTSITSGEIPILLCQASRTTAASPDPKYLEEQNTLENPRTWEFNLSRSTLLISDHGLSGTPSNVSPGLSDDDQFADPCATLDTFGQPAHKGTPRRLSLCWSSNTAAGDFIRDGYGEGYQDGSLEITFHRGTICCEDSWIAASEWDYARSSTTLSEDGRGEEQPLEPNVSYNTHLTSNEALSQRDSCVDDAQSGDYKLTLTPSSVSNSDSGLPNQDGPSSATQGTDPISFRESLHFAHSNGTDDPCSGQINSTEFCMGETSSIHSVATIGCYSSLTRRPAIHRNCYSPTYRKESEGPNLTGDIASSRSQIQNVTIIARPGDTVSKQHGIGSTPGGSPDGHVSVAAHKLPFPSRPPFTPLVLRVPQHFSPPTYAERITKTPRGAHQRRHYSWLQNTTISLVIDQEGFRTVQPVFKQSGFFRRHLPDYGGVEVDAVTFVPTTRETFRFHYAPWDGLPILRRLLINGDESRDFLSRQACLGLKTSGIYTVHGTEIASHSLGSPPSLNDNIEFITTQACIQYPDSTKLYWQFDYSVEDRRAEQTGRILNGEKIFVPLKFTCSPGLLHPNQGKKIKLMQIMKKTVAAKLTAERKQSPNVYHQTFRVPNATSPASQAWNQHKRSQSQANPRESPETSLPITSPPKHVSNRHYTPTDSTSPTTIGHTPVIRRRRASSAGESYFKPRRGFSPIRHIVPPSRLRRLVEGSSSEQGTLVEHPIPPVLLSSTEQLITEAQLDYFPLKPSPRFKN